MKKIFGKFRSRAGETLVEAMAAILVFTLASILLFTMVNSASRLNKQAIDSDLELSAELRFAEQKMKTNGSGKVTVVIGNISADEFDVNLYRKDEEAVFSYSTVKEPAGPAEPAESAD